jgi:hypothetical protein
VTLALPIIPVELTPEEERRARAYIWAIVARTTGSDADLEAEAARLWTEFGEAYRALTTGAYAKEGPEVLRLALSHL